MPMGRNVATRFARRSALRSSDLNAARRRTVAVSGLSKYQGLVSPSFMRGGPLALSGRETFGAMNNAKRTFRNIPKASMPPGRSRLSLAKNGKYIAAGVVGAYGVGAVMRRSGPATDPTIGRPTGMYGY